MKKCLFFFLTIILCINMTTVYADDSLLKDPPFQDSTVQIRDQNTSENELHSSGRGSYRSPGGSFSGGNRGGVNPGYSTGPRAPSAGVTRPRQPSPNPNRWGGFLGGAAIGALMGHLLNPFGGFGYGGGGGFSLISILFWGVILYIGYKLFQRFRGKNR
jgi:hypothetical protein